MASRLPIPGSDDGTWGNILNDYLSQEHNADGTQKTLDVTKGGTGATNASAALTNLGAVSNTDSRLSDARTPTAHQTSHQSGGTDAMIGNLDANARVSVAKSGVSVGTRRKINFIAGSNVTLTTSDDSLNEKVDVTIDASSGSVASQSSSFVVAANDASTKIKSFADYVCDGTADETEINNAIAALPSNGGKITLSEGNFNISSSILIQNDNVTMEGAGTGQRNGATQTGVGTRLNASSAISSAVILVQRAANDRPVYGVLLRDFTVDGQSQGSNVDGILFRSNRGLVDHVHVHKCTGNGIRIYGYSSPTFNTYDSEISFCQAGDNTLAGLLFDANSDDCNVVGCILYNNNDNIVIQAASQQIVNTHTYNATRYNIYFNGGGSRTKISNCKIEGAGQHGVNIDSTNGGYSDIQITGCNLTNNGDSALNTYDELIVQGPSGNGITRTLIVGNSFSTKSGVTNLPRYGVNLSSSAAQGPVVIGNSFGPNSQFGTTQINNNSNSSSPALIKNNGNASNDPAAPFINVKDFPYNIKGNSTDEGTSIQAILDALPSTGGVVYFPEGRYKTSVTLQIKNDNTTIIGAGAASSTTGVNSYGTRFEAASGISGEVILVQRAANDRAVYGITLRDFAIDGTSQAGSITGLLFRGNRGVISNVAVHNCSGNGFKVMGYSSSNADNNRFISCLTAGNSAAGFLLDSNAPNNVISGGVITSNQDGIQLVDSGATGAPTEQLISGCAITSSSRYGIYFNSAGSRTKVVNCLIKSTSNHGINLDSTNTAFSDVGIVNCHFVDSGTATTNTYDHLILQGPSGNALSRVTIVGNQFTTSAANVPRYGVNLNASSSQFTQVQSNTFGPSSHFGTRSINNNGSSSNKPIVRGNINYVTENNGTATVASGTTSIAVTHGLAVTPSLQNIYVTPTNSMGSATRYWISSPTSTQFTINVDVDPGATTATFVWQANMLY